MAKTRRWPIDLPSSLRAEREGTVAILKLARGENVDPALYYFRTVMRFETAEPSLAWLNSILALARGKREPRAVRLDVYEVQ